MPTVDQVAPLLPFLRRFARATCGSQAAGDTYVVDFLKALAADPSSLVAPGLDPKLQVFRAFLNLLNSRQRDPSIRPTFSAEEFSASDGKLASIVPRSRQAYLLRALEQFSMADVATILETNEAHVKALVDQAASQIAERLTTNVLIVEDEPMIAMDLQRLVVSLGHRVCGAARTHTEAVAAFQKFFPGLILADVKLADGSSGLEAVDEIVKSFDVPVIFITAYPERLLTGDRAEPTFLINKPFRDAAVQAVISQALFFGHRAYRGEGETRLRQLSRGE